MTVKPITPDEVASQLEKTLPDFVIEEWNKIIAESAACSSAPFTITGNVAALRLRVAAHQKNVNYNPFWLDIERLYGQYGWKVTYDKPGYNETYDGYYTFAPRGRYKTTAEV